MQEILQYSSDDLRQLRTEAGELLHSMELRTEEIIHMLGALQKGVSDRADAERAIAERAFAEQMFAEQAFAGQVFSERTSAERVSAERASADRAFAEQTVSDRAVESRVAAARRDAQLVDAGTAAALTGGLTQMINNYRTQLLHLEMAADLYDRCSGAVLAEAEAAVMEGGARQ